jgi:hypothetical protein
MAKMVFLADVPAGSIGCGFGSRSHTRFGGLHLHHVSGIVYSYWDRQGRTGLDWMHLKETLACILPVWISCSGGRVF